MSEAPLIIVLDIETGGFLSKEFKKAVSEIACLAIDPNTLVEVDRFNHMIQPYGAEYDLGAINTNGLTPEKLEREGKPKDWVVAELVKFLSSMSKSKKAFMAGHNIEKFDRPFLTRFLANEKVDLDKYFSENCLDTLLWARQTWPIGTISDHQLNTCCQKAGIELLNAHRAMADVEGNTELVRFFLKRLRGESVETETNKERFRVNFKFGGR